MVFATQTKGLELLYGAFEQGKISADEMRLLGVFLLNSGLPVENSKVESAIEMLTMVIESEASCKSLKEILSAA